MYEGIYRGKVTNTADPEGLYRVKALVPTVLKDQETAWAWPCVPPGWFQNLEHDHVDSDDLGTTTFTHSLKQFTPLAGQPVWIMFEAGDVSRPVWMGVWFIRG